MRSGNNIHVQQHKTNMINEEWNKTQNDAPFVAFYDMLAVTFVLPDELANVSIIYIEKKKIGFGTRTTQPAAILRITRKAAVRL